MLVLGVIVYVQQYECYDDGYNSGLVCCELNKNCIQQCLLDGCVWLVWQIFGLLCIEGEIWGQVCNGVWVIWGCCVEFIVECGCFLYGGGYWNGGGGWNNGGGCGEIISCDFKDCCDCCCNVIICCDVWLVCQILGMVCIEGQMWGWDCNGVWVIGGCCGQFLVN